MYAHTDISKLKKDIDATRTRLLNQHSYLLSDNERAFVAGRDRIAPTAWLDQLQRMEHDLQIRSRTWRATGRTTQ